MIIEESQLRPPSPKEMEARHVPLERVRLQWLPKCWEGETLANPEHSTNCECPRTYGYVSSYGTGFTTLELIEFHKQYVIPYEALVVGDGYEGELALDWTHLSFCETCKQWFLPDTDHTTTDTLHLAKVREMTRLLADEKPILDGICR